MTKKRDLVVGNTTYCKCFDSVNEKLYPGFKLFL